MPKKNRTKRIAYFVSPHGYGHAARACAVMDAFHRMDGSIRFDVYTKVPRWFFEESLSGPWTYHPLVSDIGFVQKNPLEIDIQETITRLDLFYPVGSELIRNLAQEVSSRKCLLVVCDIAPMGIQVAALSGIPSVLIENFTWDWLYEAYEADAPGFRPHIRHLRALFDRADFHVQTEPVCRKGEPDLVSSPVSRRTRMAGPEVRAKLSISAAEKVVLLTMGGIPGKLPSIEILQAQKDIRFLIPGASRRTRQNRNLVLLPRRSEYFHPDLVEASDAVVGKIGYSTLAETFNSGVPFGYIARKEFRESEPLVSFAKAHMHGMAIAKNNFNNGEWVAALPELLAFPRVIRGNAVGAERVAGFIKHCLEGVLS